MPISRRPYSEPCCDGEPSLLGTLLGRPGKAQPSEWGHGFATEAGAGAIEYGFTQLSLDAIYAIVDQGNTRSSNVCRRLGMTFLHLTSRYHERELELYELKRPQ